MDEQKTLVSLIVRTKDRPKLLERALRSIAAQTYRPIEVVLVNDGGCDLEIEELKTILGDVSLDYQRLEQNTGRAHAGNVGIENAHGDYIGFLDDDDEFYPEHVETLMTSLEQSDYKIAYTDSLMVFKDIDPNMQEINVIRKELLYSEDFNYDKLLFDNYIPFMCLLFDREVLIGSGGLDRNFELYEDYDLLIRLGEKYLFQHIKKITADYNQWSDSSQISQRNSDSNFLRKAYVNLFSKHIDKFTPERIYNYRSAITITKDIHIKNLESLIKDKDAYAKSLETLVKDKDERVKDLKDVIKGKDQYITSLASQIKLRDQQVITREPGVAQKNICIADRQKGQYIANLESLVKEKDSVLNSIYSSHGWKALLLYYKVRDRLLPSHSVRRRFIKGVFKCVLTVPEYLKKKRIS